MHSPGGKRGTDKTREKGTLFGGNETRKIFLVTLRGSRQEGERIDSGNVGDKEKGVNSFPGKEDWGGGKDGKYLVKKNWGGKDTVMVIWIERKKKKRKRKRIVRFGGCFHVATLHKERIQVDEIAFAEKEKENEWRMDQGGAGAFRGGRDRRVEGLVSREGKKERQN